MLMPLGDLKSTCPLNCSLLCMHYTQPALWGKACHVYICCGNPFDVWSLCKKKNLNTFLKSVSAFSIAGRSMELRGSFEKAGQRHQEEKTAGHGTFLCLKLPWATETGWVLPRASTYQASPGNAAAHIATMKVTLFPLQSLSLKKLEGNVNCIRMTFSELEMGHTEEALVFVILSYRSGIHQFLSGQVILHHMSRKCQVGIYRLPSRDTQASVDKSLIKFQTSPEAVTKSTFNPHKSNIFLWHFNCFYRSNVFQLYTIFSNL